MPSTKILRMLGCLALAGAAHAQVRYVDDTATGTNDGTSWANAFVDLQAALAVAGSGSQVWVAEGLYKPSLTGDVIASFMIPSNVAVYGGFAGTETSIAQRVVDAHPTILSGDLAGDSGLSFSNLSDNSEHVVRIHGGSSLTRLDGLIIQGGNAAGGHGGGILSDFAPSTPVVHGCILRFNAANFFGGGMFANGQPTITSCLFHDNVAGLDGGGLDLEGTGCVVAGSRFIRNRTLSGGASGAIWVVALIDVSSCVFSGNTGGIYSEVPNGSIRACTFHANTVADIVANGPISTTNCILGPDAGVAQFADPLGADGIAGTLDDDLRLLPSSPFIDAGDNTQVTASMLFDVAGLPRQVDDPLTPDTGSGTPPLIDRGAHEYQPCAAPTNFCVGAPNSVGPGAVMGFVGSAHLYAHDMLLTSSGLPPNAVGLFFHGTQAIQVPFANGFRCVGGTVSRIGIVVGNAAGVASVVFDTAGAQLGAGDVRLFQHWYRNPAAGGAGSNLSDGLRIVFCP